MVAPILFWLCLAQAPSDDVLARAGAHLEAGEIQPAIELLHGALEKQPDWLPARFQLGLAYAMAERRTEAIAEFRKVLAVESELYEAQLNLGRLLVETGQFSEAREFLVKAAERKPDEAAPWVFLARAWAGEGQPAEAAKALQKATGLDASLNSLELELAEYLERSGQRAEAAAIYRKHPEVPGARERYALYLLDSGDAAGAAAELEALAQQSPTPAVRYALATAYLRAGQPQKSLQQAIALVEQDPENLEIRLFAGRLLRDEKRYPQAAQQFAAAVKQKPDSLEAWNEFTSMLILMEQHEPALQALERVRALGDETPAYHYFRAMLLDAQKQYRPALESYRRFLEKSAGQHPEEEFKARQRARILERILNK